MQWLDRAMDWVRDKTEQRRGDPAHIAGVFDPDAYDQYSLVPAHQFAEDFCRLRFALSEGADRHGLACEVGREAMPSLVNFVKSPVSPQQPETMALFSGFNAVHEKLQDLSPDWWAEDAPGVDAAEARRRHQTMTTDLKSLFVESMGHHVAHQLADQGRWPEGGIGPATVSGPPPASSQEASQMLDQLTTATDAKQFLGLWARLSDPAVLQTGWGEAVPAQLGRIGGQMIRQSVDPDGPSADEAPAVASAPAPTPQR